MEPWFRDEIQRKILDLLGLPHNIIEGEAKRVDEPPKEPEMPRSLLRLFGKPA